VGDEHDRPLDGADQVADGRGVGGEAAQRSGRGDDAVPLATSGSITPSQLADSANTPWTRTIVLDMATVRSAEEVPVAPPGVDRDGTSEDRMAA
jgi:hypothetical protein